MKRTIGRWQRGWAVLAAGFLALALAACSSGSSAGLPIVTENSLKDPTTISEPAPKEAAELMIKEGFKIQLDHSTSFVGRGAQVTVSTSDIVLSRSGEVKEVVVTFDGEEVQSSFEIVSTPDGSRSEIRATFTVPGDANSGAHQVVLRINGVASAAEIFQVKSSFVRLSLPRDASLSRPRKLDALVHPVRVGALPAISDSSAGESAAAPPAGSDSGAEMDENERNSMSIAAGEKHTCVARGESVYCWGGNRFRQLGTGTASRGEEAPVMVLEGDVANGNPFNAAGVKKLVAGRNHTCALKDDDTVWCWGRNLAGQLGGGFVSVDGVNQCFPNQRLVPADGIYYGAIQVVADDTNTNDADSTRPLTNVTDIAASGDRTCALTNQGRLYCWGYRTGGHMNASDQLNPVNERSICAAVPVSIRPDTPMGGILQLVVGDDIYIRGRMDSSIHFLKPSVSQPNDPRLYTMEAVPNTGGISLLTARGDAVCGVDEAGTTMCWRRNQHDDSLGRLRIAVENAISISIGEPSAFNQIVYCAMRAPNDELICRYLDSRNPHFLVTDPMDAESAVAGTGFVCYVSHDQRIYCNGDTCSDGQCGHRQSYDSRAWVEVPSA